MSVSQFFVYCSSVFICHMILECFPICGMIFFVALVWLHLPKVVCSSGLRNLILALMFLGCEQSESMQLTCKPTSEECHALSCAAREILIMGS